MGIRTFSTWSCSGILLLCFASLPCNAQTSAPTAPHSFSLEQVLSSPFATNLVAAGPTNDHAGRIACVFSVRGERNVWIADAPNLETRQAAHRGVVPVLPTPALVLSPAR